MSHFAPGLGLTREPSQEKRGSENIQNYAKRASVRFDVTPIKAEAGKNRQSAFADQHNTSHTADRRPSVMDMNQHPLIKKIEGFEGVDLRKDFGVIMR